MRAIKLALIIIIGLALMMVIAANWTPVDLNLIPPAIGLDGLSYPQVPLALIIGAAVLLGYLLAYCVEFLKGGETRRRMNEKSAVIAKLRRENARLSKKVQEEDDDLELLAS